MKIFLFNAFSLSEDTPKQSRLRAGVVACGGWIRHVSDSDGDGTTWAFLGGGSYQAFGVFDVDEEAIEFKLRYM